MSVFFNPLIFSGLDFSGGAAGSVEWRSPVPDEASLPITGNLNGEARVTLDTDKIYVWDASISRWVDTEITSASFGSSPNLEGQTIGVDDSTPNIRRRTLTLQPADENNPGGVSITTQTFKGDKTFKDDVIIEGLLDPQGQINYSPTTPADWNPSPSRVESALDQLASRFVERDELVKEPTGFINLIDSQVTFNDSNRTLTIQPTGISFDVYVKGRHFLKTAAETIAIPSLPGSHYIYYTPSGTLASTQTPSPLLFQDNAMVSIVYWNTDTNTHTYFAEERHGLVMDGATHTYLHTVFGTRFISGLALQGFNADGSGNLASNAQFTADQGTIKDEDLTLQLPAQTQIPILYRQGQLWRKKTADSFPIIYNGTAGYVGARLPYNQFVGGSWQLTEVLNNRFVLVHVFGTNDKDTPVIGIQGINEYTDVTSARIAAGTEITSLSGLPFAEFVAIGSVVFETANSYSNVPKARIRSVNGGSYVDFRGTQLYTPAGVATTHGLLAGLSSDDHFQYLLTDGSRLLSGDFNTNNNKVINLSAGTNPTDAVNVGQLAASTSGTANTFSGYNGSGVLTSVPGWSYDDTGATRIGAQNSLIIPPSTTDFTAISLSPTVSNPGINFLSGIQVNPEINQPVGDLTTFQVYGYGSGAPSIYKTILSQPGFNGSVLDLTHFSASGSVSGTNSVGFNYGPTGNFTNSTGVLINSSGIATNFTGINIISLNSGTSYAGLKIEGIANYTDITGISVDLSSTTSPNRKVGLLINDGSISSSSQFTTTSSLPVVVDSGNVIRPVFSVTSGSPVSNTDVLMTNLAGLMQFNDDYSASSALNIGVSSVGFVSQISSQSGVVVEKISALTAGLAIEGSSTGGTVVDAHIINANCFSFGGSLDITNLYGLRVESGLSVLANNTFGISVEDSGAENYLAKSLVIGGTSKVVGDQNIALDIQAAKTVALGKATTSERNAITNFSGSLIFDDDQKVFYGNTGATWVPVGPSYGDISQTPFTALNNTTTPSNVTNLAFSNSVTKSFSVQLSVVRGGSYAQYTLLGIQRASSWELSQDYIGDDTGISFIITAAGQIQYTLTNTGINATLLFRAQTV